MMDLIRGQNILGIASLFLTVAEKGGQHVSVNHGAHGDDLPPKSSHTSAPIPQYIVESWNPDGYSTSRIHSKPTIF